MRLVEGSALIPLLLVIFCCTVTADKPCCDDYCYANDPPWPQRSDYSTKTAYEVARAGQTSNDYKIPNCIPKKIWILNRHGTRLPTAKEMKNMIHLESLRDEIISNYEERNTKPVDGPLCGSDLTNLKNWAWNTSITEDQEEFLVDQGRKDLRLIAQHYQKLYPDLLTRTYYPEKFLFRHTETQRTKASFEAFADGLFGSLSITLPPPPEKDYLLKSYDLCPAWVDQKETKKDSKSEYQKFIKSSTFQRLISDVSQRLGFQTALSVKQIDTIWDMCRYEQAWFVEGLSPWCAVFTKPQVRVLEYLEDIKYYYKQGYGGPLNANVPCFAVQDMLKHLEGEQDPSVVAYFSHSSEIQLFLTALGIAKDSDSVRADNFNKMEHRQWRTSKIGSFAANLAAVKYDCNNVTPNKVMFFLNEKPVKFEWCNGGSLCDLSAVLSQFKRFKEADCPATFCTTSKSSALAWSVGAVVTSALLTLYRGN